MGSLICVTIGRGRHRHLIAEYKHLAEQGAKLIELRLDFIQRTPNLRRILAEKVCPVVVTVRRERDGGMWKGTEQERIMLIRSAIADGVDYIDLEEDIAGSIPRFGKTKRIVSYHNFMETPKNLEELHTRMAGLQADIVKIATLANNPHDNVRMLQLVKQATVPTIGICMGEFGTPSRILAGKFGAPFSYATFQIERTMAPGQLSYATMRDVYRYESINADTEVYGVIADPVAHSMSPLVHNAGFAQAGLNKVYVPFRVPRDYLAGFLRDCESLDIRGLSVTIPHKEALVDLLTKADDAVSNIHAANTVLVKPNELVGYNTDYRAAMASIEQAFAHRLQTNDEESSLAGCTALVLGAGGVAKAIVYGLKRRSAEVIITNRSPQRAQDLADMYRAKTVPWEARHTIRPDLLVNCTPVGMHPHVNETPFEGVHMVSQTVVFDTVYNPEQTLLLKLAKEQGCKIITGIDMFVGQAAEQYQLFTNSPAPHDLMRQVIRRAISAVKS